MRPAATSASTSGRETTGDVTYPPTAADTTEIFGANYYGVVVNAAAVNVTTSTIHDIGESPLNGSQHGVGVLYTTIDQAGASTGAHASGFIVSTTRSGTTRRTASSSVVTALR